MLVDKQCCRNIDSGKYNAAGIIGIEQWKPSMCEMANICNSSTALVFMRRDPIVDDGGEPGLKTPSSLLAWDPLRGQDQDRDQALRYA